MWFIGNSRSEQKGDVSLGGSEPVSCFTSEARKIIGQAEPIEDISLNRPTSRLAHTLTPISRTSSHGTMFAGRG